MKNIILLMIIIPAYLKLQAQVTFSPSVFTAQDSVTMVVDVSGTDMAGQTEAFIWIFSNVSGGGKDGFTNTNFGNSPETARMVNVGTNRWRYGFIGITMFSQTPAELKDFGLLIKSKDGSKKTPDYKPFAFDPLIFTPVKLRIFPSKVDIDDVVTLNFDRSLGEGVDELRMAPSSVTVTAFDETGMQVGTALTKNVTNTAGTSIWSAAFIPNVSFTPAAGRSLSRFRYKFNGTVLDISGSPSPVSTSEAEVTFTKLK